MRLQALRAKLKGEPEPVARSNGRYPELYHYQQQAKDNYPLFYPAARRPLTPREMVRDRGRQHAPRPARPAGLQLGRRRVAHGHDARLPAHRRRPLSEIRAGLRRALAARGNRAAVAPSAAIAAIGDPARRCVELYEATKDRRALELAQQIAAFIGHDAERTRDGGLSHFAGKRQLWDDTLFMVCPVLAPLGRVTAQAGLAGRGRAAVADFRRPSPRSARRAALSHVGRGDRRAQPLFLGPRQRLGRHVVRRSVEEHAGRRAPTGRGWSTAIASCSAALVARQDRQSGLWHTVLDDPSSYGETSATAMIVYSMIEGRRLHLLDAAYDEPIERSWAGLSTQVNNMGQAIGVSGGTGPGDRESYLARPQGVYPWGTGAMLMAASAMAEGEPSK